MNGDLRAQAIVDAALALAEETGWERVRLHTIAERLAIPLSDVLDRFRDLDAVADAWFLRAWHAMVTPGEHEADLPARERLFAAMMRWFDALAPHRRVTGEMLSAKFYASHPHHWLPAIFNLSRTIHWLREAAHLDAVGVRRQAEEIALSGLFVVSLNTWLRDDSLGQHHTREVLRRRLNRLCSLADTVASTPPRTRRRTA